MRPILTRMTQQNAYSEKISMRQIFSPCVAWRGVLGQSEVRALRLPLPVTSRTTASTAGGFGWWCSPKTLNSDASGLCFSEL